MLLGAERENDITINFLSHNMSALYMQGGSSSARSSQFNNGASCSNSVDKESSSIGGRIIVVPRVPYRSQPPRFTLLSSQAQSQPQPQP